MLSILAGIWHTFDGVAYFPGAFADGLLDHLKAWFKHGTFRDKFCYDAVASAKVFLPSAEDIHKSSLTPASNGETTMEGYLEKIDHVMSSLKLKMFKDRHLFFVDESLVKQVCTCTCFHLVDGYFYHVALITKNSLSVIYCQ